MWDVYNNYTQSAIEFKVSDKYRTTLSNVIAYPNPAKDFIYFKFHHNQPEKDLYLTIKLYDTGGSLARSFTKRFDPRDI